MTNPFIAALERAEQLLNERASEIEILRSALEEIETKYTAIMRDPPDWTNLSEDQLRWAREAWYGASLIARRALGRPL